MIPNRAIFSMDPGGHSGLAWCVVDIKAPLEEMFKNTTIIGSETIVGDEYSQIRAISGLWIKFYRECVLTRCMPPDSIEFVSEDFVQRPGGSGGKEGNSPIRILWGVEGYRMGRADEFKGRRGSLLRVNAPPIILQHPSLGAAVTSKRLREYDLWVVGKEHERSAFKHIVTRVQKIKRTL